MANSNFVVHNGLTVGPLTIDAATGSITTSGDVNITGNLGVSQISKNDSSISIIDNGTGSNVSIVIDGTTEHILSSSLTTLNTALTVTGDITTNGTVYSPSQTTSLSLSDIGLVVINSGGGEFKFGAAGIQSSAGLYGGAFGGSKLSLNDETNLIASVFDVVKIQTGTSSSVQNTWTFSNSALITPGTITSAGNVVISSGTEVTSTTTGALVVNGGINASGNAYVGTNLYIGASALSQTFANPTMIAVDSGSNYAQIALKNTNANGSADYAAYGETGTDASGWMDMGFAGSTFNDGNYTITKPNDGYLFTRPTSATYGGNLTIATSETGSYNDVVIGVGSFHANAVVARFHGNATSSGYLALTQGTASSSTTTGALVVTGGVGISGALNIGGTSNHAGASNFASGLTASTVSAGTIGNSGATLTGTVSTAAQTNITSVGTLTGLTVSGATQVNSTLGVTGITQITNSTNSTGASSGALQVTGGASIGGNVYIAGNLTVAGSQTTFSANNITVDDSIIYIANSNSGDLVDIGVVGHFINPGYQHTGFVRDASDGVWKLFANVTAEPTTTVDFTNAIYSPVKTGAITSTGTVIASSINAGTIGNSGASIVGTISTAAQTSITSVGTLTSLSVSGALSAGSFTVPTAAQPNITSVGTLTSLSVSGALSVGSITIPTAAQPNITSLGTLTGLTVSGAIVPNANLTINIGATNAWFNTFYGVSTQAKYADLAENYQADDLYPAGTVVMFGGDAEVTVASADTTAVAGVVSTNPAHLMNGQLTGTNVIPLALQGRVPCMVIGPINKGDMLVSAGFGYAKASENPRIGQVIGKALQDHPTASKAVIEVVVGRV